jgi:hypothetical protein
VLEKHIPNVLFSGKVIVIVALFFAFWMHYRLRSERKEGQQTPLMRAAAMSKVQQLKGFLQSGFDVNEKDYLGNTALHYAAQNAGYPKGIKSVELLLSYKADPTIVDNDHRTPLHIAASYISDPKVLIKVLGLLVDAGGDLNARTKNIIQGGITNDSVLDKEQNFSVLDIVVSQSNNEAVRLILQKWWPALLTSKTVKRAKEYAKSLGFVAVNSMFEL